VGYRELLEALEEEVSRKAEECRAEAARESARILDEAQGELRARRETALADERRRLAEDAARALSAARLEQERALLGEMRRLMDELRSQAEARLSGLNDARLLTRLLDEVVPELGEGPLTFRVEPDDERELERQLRERHPELLSRSTIESAPGLHGGLEVELGSRQRLDNTLRSRLENAWRRLEPEIAARLLGTEHEEAPPERAPRDEAVAVTSPAGERRAGGCDGPR
jgi:vacuolar-type H+-ATPase subunit E/Vma4